MSGRWISSDDDVTPRAWASLAVVASGSFVTSLDATVLYVAFGDIRRDFPEVGPAALSWVLSGYTIVIAAGMIAAGAVVDAVRRAMVARNRSQGART